MIQQLHKYDTIIFDLDGVLTSEQAYWNSAALTVYEMINSREYFGDKQLDVAYASEHYPEIRAEIFSNDKTIISWKNKGVNSNWDLAYVCLSAYLLTGSIDKVYDYIHNFDGGALELYDFLGKQLSEKLNKPFDYTKRCGDLWHELVRVFQRWCFGTDDRIGLLTNEKPLIDLPQLHTLLRTLSATHTLAVGSGRTYEEIEPPFIRWDILQYFDYNRIISYADVLQAEKSHGGTYSKPHAYMFIKAAMGKDFDDGKAVSGNYDSARMRKCVVVGDAGADIIAAQAAGMDFIAVLTGINGTGARGYFEEMKATYILDNVMEMIN